VWPAPPNEFETPAVVYDYTYDYCERRPMNYPLLCTYRMCLCHIRPTHCCAINNLIIVLMSYLVFYLFYFYLLHLLFIVFYLLSRYSNIETSLAMSTLATLSSLAMSGLAFSVAPVAAGLPAESRLV